MNEKLTHRIMHLIFIRNQNVWKRGGETNMKKKCMVCGESLKEDTVFCSEECFLVRKKEFDKYG